MELKHVRKSTQHKESETMFKGNQTKPNTTNNAQPSKPAYSSFIKSILGAEPSGNKNPFITDGEYLWEVVKCEEKTFQGSSAVIELKVLESKAINDLDKPNPVDEIVSYHNNTAKSKSAAGNILAFFMALTGCDDKEDPSFGETVSASFGPDQLASGLLIRGRTFRSIIKSGANAGKEFVGVNFYHVPSEEVSPDPSKPQPKI